MAFWYGKIVGALFLPPVPFILLIFTGLMLSSTRQKGALLLGSMGSCAVLLSTLPSVAVHLTTATQGDCDPVGSSARKADAIVVLGGGVRRHAPEFGGRAALTALQLERLRYAARLHRSTHLPLLVTGGSPWGEVAEARLMQETLLEDFSVPVKWVEDASRTTRENARFSSDLLRREGVGRIFLVSQGWHLRRAVSAFEREGLEVYPAGTGCRSPQDFGFNGWFPSPEGFEMTYWSAHEWLGALWYALLAQADRAFGE